MTSYDSQYEWKKTPRVLPLLMTSYDSQYEWKKTPRVPPLLTTHSMKLFHTVWKRTMVRFFLSKLKLKL
jgi:hypothetical protein